MRSINILHLVHKSVLNPLTDSNLVTGLGTRVLVLIPSLQVLLGSLLFLSTNDQLHTLLPPEVTFSTSSFVQVPRVVCLMVWLNSRLQCKQRKCDVLLNSTASSTDQSEEIKDKILRTLWIRHNLLPHTFCPQTKQFLFPDFFWNSFNFFSRAAIVKYQESMKMNINAQTQKRLF